jgi:hypothetical protein
MEARLRHFVEGGHIMVRQGLFWAVLLLAGIGVVLLNWRSRFFLVLLLNLEGPFPRQKSAGDWVKELRSRDPLVDYWGGTFTPRDEGPVRAREVLVRLGPGAIPALTRALKDEDPLTRVNAAWALWQISRRSELAVPVCWRP